MSLCYINVSYHFLWPKCWWVSPLNLLATPSTLLHIYFTDHPQYQGRVCHILACLAVWYGVLNFSLEMKGKAIRLWNNFCLSICLPLEVRNISIASPAFFYLKSKNLFILYLLLFILLILFILKGYLN